MIELYTQEAAGFGTVDVMPSLKEIKGMEKCEIKRGDAILIDAIDKGEKTGEKELVIVAGFTYSSNTRPSITLWYGDPEYIVRKKRFVVVGRPFTIEMVKEIVKIEIPKM